MEGGNAAGDYATPVQVFDGDAAAHLLPLIRHLIDCGEVWQEPLRH